MHYLQKSILDNLRYSPQATYTSLMPDNIESSHFRYHLKQLMAEGLVQKNADGLYELTNKGQRDVDYMSENRTTTIRTPKVITYTLLRHGDTLFLHKKAKEPYLGLLGLIGGKVHFGEDTQAAAQREVQEKTGLALANPRFCGVANIRTDKNQEPLSHVIAYIYVIELETALNELPAGLVPVNRESLNEHALIPDLVPILQQLDSGQVQFVTDIHCSLQ